MSHSHVISRAEHLVFLIIVALLLPYWISDGMCLDGVFYSSISRNLSQGLGDYWQLFYSKSADAEFYSHPPLHFWIQAVFYKALGTSIYVERLYCAIITLLTYIGILKMWRIMPTDSDNEASGWLIALLWIMTPIVYWGYRHNILDITLCLFCLYSSYYYIKFLRQRHLFILLLGFLFHLCAILTKGPVGLFPVLVPFLYLLIIEKKQFQKALIQSFSLAVALTFALSALYYFIPEAANYFREYWQHQILESVNGLNEVTTKSRFTILKYLLQELAVPLIFTIGLLILKRNKLKNNLSNKYFLFYLILGFSATLPYMVSLKQNRFYLISSIPYFIFSIGYYFNRELAFLSDYLTTKLERCYRRVCVLLGILVICFSVMRYDQPYRDTDLLKDVYKLSEILNQGTTISSSHEVAANYKFVAYLNRNGMLYVDPFTLHHYHILNKGNIIADGEQSEFELYKELILFDLYKRK